jgi:hypothetical protein
VNRPACRLLIAAALALPCWAGGCLSPVVPIPGSESPARWEPSGRNGWLYSSGDLRARVWPTGHVRSLAYRWEVYSADRPGKRLDWSVDDRLTLEEAKEQAEEAVEDLR